MSLLTTVTSALAAWPEARLVGNSVVIPTHCIYPSGGIVEVFVEGGRETFVVSDNAGAVDILEGAGGHNLPNVKRLIDTVAKRYGLHGVKGGTLRSSAVPLGALAATIVLVANASQHAAESLLHHFKPVLDRNFRLDLDKLLQSRFGASLKKRTPLVGASSKAHKVDYLIPLGDQRQLVLDAVVPDASSINAAIVTHMDLRSAEIAGLEQRVVFDDALPWKAADLRLLRVGTIPVAFSRLPEAIGRLAADIH